MKSLDIKLLAIAITIAGVITNPNSSHKLSSHELTSYRLTSY